MQLVQDNRPYEPVTESPRLYDPEKATDLRGTIQDIKTVKPSPKAANFLQLDLKTAKGPVRVHLAPQWFLEEQSHLLELKKGAEVEVRGSPNVVDGKSLFIAAEIARPDREQRLRLRHKDGTPVWDASERTS